MARIRSVHPSLFTDEAWVTCSPLARLLYVGLMTDADDQGLFEWKPLQIKMRLLAGDGADVPSLLAELVAVNLISPLEAGGKKLGAIRYFRKFQRPKKPNAVYVLPPEWAAYVGLGVAGSEPADDEGDPVGNQFPPGGEIPPQMEDGGGRKEEEVEAIASIVAEEPATPPIRLVIPEPKTADEVRQAFDEWNALAAKHGLPKAKTLDPGRRAALRSRLAERGLDGWREAIAAVARSRHCLGGNDRGWRADLDFVCQPKSWRRLLEGFYGDDGDDGEQPLQGTQNGRPLPPPSDNYLRRQANLARSFAAAEQVGERYKREH